MDPAQQQLQQLQQQQETVDAGHIRLLSIFHYIYGGLAFLGLLGLGVHYAIMRFAIMKMPAQAGNQAEIEQLRTMFRFFIFFYLIMGVFCILTGVCNILCGKFLTKRTNKVFIFIVSGFNCLNMPLGTVLGVFTFIVLMRPSVTARFDAAKAH